MDGAQSGGLSFFSAHLEVFFFLLIVPESVLTVSYELFAT